MMRVSVVDIEPVGDRPELQQARANAWRSQSARDEAATRSLIRGIATRLIQADGVVVMHFDADVPWKSSHRSTNVAQCDAFCVRLEQVVRAKTLDPAARDAAMKRLVPCIPHYSIEAWTYQATDVAVRICVAQHGGADVDRFRAWGNDRALLDGVIRPKESAVSRDRHNAELAEGVPVHDVVATRNRSPASEKLFVRCRS